MNWFLVITAPIWLIPVLALLYPFAILPFTRGGLWWLLFPFITVPAWIIDVVLNRTSLALLFNRWPRWGEWTFSQALKNFKDEDSDRARLATPVIAFLRHFDPGHI